MKLVLKRLPKPEYGFSHDSAPGERKPGTLILLFLVGIFLVVSATTTVPAQGAQTKQNEPEKQTDDKEIEDAPFESGQETDNAKPKLPEGVSIYMGRRVAQTMHFAGAEWLVRNEREREERCSLMLANLGVKPGMTVCDMGCGNGFHSLQIAKMIGKEGRVFGVDVQPEMLGFLRERVEAEVIENVIPILGSYHNPRLPPNSIDLVLMVDVYHEFSHPEEMLAAIRKSLKPDGLAVLVEFREEDPKVPIKPLHKMSKAQVNRELTANGFKLVKEFEKLPWQHMMFFGIDESKNAPEISPAPDKLKPESEELEKQSDSDSKRLPESDR